MFASALTIVVITLIITGVSYYAYRRVTKVHREAQARTAAHEAALLAEVTASAPTVSQRSGFAGKPRPVSTDKTVNPAAAPPLAVDEPLSEPPVRAEPVSVQDEIRAFLGDTTGVEPVPEKMDDEDPSPTVDEADTLPAEEHLPPVDSPPEVSPRTSFDVAADDLAQALRDAATLVEEQAAAPGTPQERAARTLSAVTAAIGALPLSSLFATEDPTPKA